MDPAYPTTTSFAGNNPSVAFLGPEGSFTWLAARTAFGNAATYVETPAHEIPRTVQRRGRQGGCDYGILPAANIKHGFIESTFRALYDTADVKIMGEVLLPVEFHLISSARSLDEIHTVVSHEAALSQCQNSLDRLSALLRRPLARVTASSTSAAVKQARTVPGLAALGSAHAARQFDVPVLQAAMQDHAENVTRFWVFGFGQTPDRTARSKTLFLVELQDGTQSLQRLIQLFESAGVKIVTMKPHGIPQQSRAEAWRYAYFIECEGHVEDPGLNAVHRALKRADWDVMRGRSGRLLGSFPSFPSGTLRFSRGVPATRRLVTERMTSVS